MNFTNPYAAVDMAILRYHEGMLQIYLVKLKYSPFENAYALPGGLLAPSENFEQAIQRCYKEATGSRRIAGVDQVYTFSEPDRDPRQRCISTAYLVFPADKFARLAAGDKYVSGDWYDAHHLPVSLAYDHNLILDTCLERITAKLNYTTISVLLLPGEFTLSDMQQLYELCLGEVMDKRNFRKKVLSLDILEPTGNMLRGQKARPATLYRAKSTELRIIRLFK